MKKNIKKNFSKKNITLLSIVSSIVAVPIIASSSHIYLNSKNSLYSNNQSSTITNSMIDYIKTNHKKGIRKIENENTKWSIDYNKKQYFFNDPKEINDFIYKNIISPGKETWVSSVADLSKYSGSMGDVEIDKLINNDEISFFAKEQTTNVSSLTQEIYKGNNDTAYKTEKEAKESFYSRGEAYFFNEIYFTNKEDLKSYLLNEYLPNNKTQYNTITLKGPNGNVSQPINVTSKSASLEVERFIRNNAIATIDYTNSETNEIISLNESNIDNNLNKVNLKDLSYLHVQSNQGESRYVVDNYDSSNLIGPYFYKGNLDIGAFKNKKMWRKTNDIKKQVYVESKIDTLIGSFFSTIINDDKALTLREASQDGTVPLLFRTMVTKVNENAIIDQKTGQLVDETLPLDDWFLIELKKLSPQLFYEVTVNNLALILGNKYNTFYKIPTLYNFLLSRIINWGLGQDVLDLVNYYFTQVTNYIQDVLEIVFDDKSIFEKKVGDKIQYFNMKEFFQIGNPEYDINTSIEYFMNEIKTYPKLVAAMWAYNSAFSNLFLTGGMIPFSSNDASYLFENNLISKTDFESNAGTFKKIYDIFSSNNYNDMVHLLINNSSNPNIVSISKLDKSLWIKEFEKLNGRLTGIPYSVVFKSIGLKNNEYAALAKAFIDEEIKLFNDTGRIFENGYLQQLYNKDKRKDSLANFITYMNANPDENSYSVYLVYLFAHKLNLTDLMGANEYTDKTAFGLAIARIISFAFGTSALVGSTINSVYANGSFGVKNDTHTISKMADATTTESDARNINKNQPKNDNENDPYVFSLEKWTKEVDTKIKPKKENVNKNFYIMFEDPSSKNDNNSSTRIINQNNDGIQTRHINGMVGGGVSKIRLSRLSPEETARILLYTNPFISSTRIMFEFNFTERDWTIFKKGFFEDRLQGNRWFKYGYSPRPDIGDVILRDKEFEVLAKKMLFFVDEEIPGYPNYIIIDDIVNGGSRPNTPSDRPTTPPIDPDRPTTPPTDPDRPTTPPPSPNGSQTSNKFNRDDISNKSVDASKKWWKKSNVDVVDGKFNLIAGKNAGVSILSKTKDAFNTVVGVVSDYILPIIGTAMMALEIVTMMIDLFKTTIIKDFYVYTTADGTEFIWDGGLTISKYLGFDVREVNGIQSMKVIEPIKITLPQLEEYYFFDKVKYYDSNEMKRSVLLSMIKNKSIFGSNQESFKIKYSLTDKEQIIDGASTIDELIEYIYNQIGVSKNKDGSLDVTNLNKNSKLLSNLSYAFSDGLIATDNSKYIAITNNILENIRKTNIIQLPKLDINNNALSNTNFILSGKVFENGSVKDISSEYEYIVDNTANFLKEGVKPDLGNYNSSNYLIENIKNAELNSLNNVINKFNTTINVDKKTGILADIPSKKYSEISSNVSKHELYNVNLDPTIGNLIFWNYSDAQRYILSQLNFKKHATYTMVNVYEYNGKTIYGDEELKQYAKKFVLSNF